MAKSKTLIATTQEIPPAEDTTFRSYNRAQLAGRLVSDPELRYTPNGKAVCRMRVATNDTRATHFHGVVAWEELAEHAAASFRKGAAVVVEGRISTQSWESSDGTKHRSPEIVGSAIHG